ARLIDSPTGALVSLSTVCALALLGTGDAVGAAMWGTASGRENVPWGLGAAVRGCAGGGTFVPSPTLGASAGASVLGLTTAPLWLAAVGMVRLCPTSIWS